MKWSSVVVVSMALASIQSVSAATAGQVIQFGVTWTFDKAYEVGQFVTGDWWVVVPSF